MVKCKCGCGNDFNSTDKYGRTRLYIHGHNAKGRRMSEETKQRLSRERTGSLNPAFGKTTSDKQKQAASMLWKGKPLPEAIKIKMSATKRGKLFTDEHKLKLKEAFKGRKHTDETRKKMSLSKRGDKSSFWKGGVTEESQLIRSSSKYKQWRSAVFTRDGYKCTKCGNTGFVQADHIKPFSLFPELRFDVSNGRTLCKPCHKDTPTYGRKIRGYVDCQPIDMTKTQMI